MTKQDWEAEKEASTFAMLLLMPTKFVNEDMKNGMDLTDDYKLKEMAKKYSVSLTTVAMRIAYFIKHNY